ncbi:MAG TPA: SRPBCC family protein [Micromonosporaceae bacterium]|jgi:uncharacterized protein YndB with AHSA1/START domain|nr:SRPBCC family protein [Micromonosporaceae bacterium]
MTAVQITRTFAAPLARVWLALTEPEALMAWFWPARMATKVTADVRTGGRFRIDATAGGFAASGTYQEVTPMQRLVMTWRWDGEEHDSLVTIELTANDDRTDLVLRHDLLPSAQSRDDHEQGWNDCLDRLPDWLAAA